MEIELSSLAALIALPASFALALWPIIRDRSAIIRLEKLADIVCKLESDNPTRELLENARDDLALRVAINYFVRIRYVAIFVGLALLCGAFGFYYIAGGFHGANKYPDPPLWVPLVTAVVGSSGMTTLVIQQRNRTERILKARSRFPSKTPI